MNLCVMLCEMNKKTNNINKINQRQAFVSKEEEKTHNPYNGLHDVIKRDN